VPGPTEKSERPRGRGVSQCIPVGLLASTAGSG
jgi:hypothetical protein